MAALDHYVTSVRTLSSQANYSGITELMHKSYDSLTKNSANLDTAFGALDIEEHSLGVLGILWAKSHSSTDFEVLFSQIQQFMLLCSAEQIRHAPDNFTDVCKRLTQSLINKKQPIRGITVLASAIRKLQTSPSHLTSIHADFCQLCLVAKCFKPALPILDQDITEITKEDQECVMRSPGVVTYQGGKHFDVKWLLLYYYYGGMIYSAVKKMDRALYFFEIVVTTPSMAVSHIMIEACKKYILVSLIVHGKVAVLPRYTSHVVSKYVKPLCQPYYDLAHVYESSGNNPAETQAMIHKHTQVFEKDKNAGLAKQCLTALYKTNIQRLTKTFVTLSLTDMASRVQLSGPQEAERYIFKMIADGEIYAMINQKDGMVQFLDSPEKYNSVGMLAELDNHMTRCIQLEKDLQEMDKNISVSQQFVQKSSKSQEMDI